MNRCTFVFAVLSLVACGKKGDQQDQPPAAPPKVTDTAAKVGSAAAEVKDKAGSAVAAVQDKVGQAKDAVGGAGKAALTAESYEKLIVGLEGCTIKGYDIDGKCPAMLALREGLKNSSTGLKDMAGMSAGVGKKLLGHASAPVRLYAAGLMGGLLGTDASSQDALVEAAAKETDLGVLQGMIRTVANSGARNPKVAELLLKSADHADVAVRLQAVYAISSGWNQEMKGGPEKLAAMVDGDKDPKVRQAACEYAGGLGAKSLVATYDKHTAKSDDKDLYSACMKGLVAMFHNYPLYDTDEEGAYKLFLKRLNAKPRSEAAPPWTVMGAFRYANTGDRNTKLVEWQKKATWFKPAEVKKALAGVIADKQSNWMSRTGAVESMAGLGANKKELEALKVGYDAKESTDGYVLKKIDEALAKAP